MNVLISTQNSPTIQTEYTDLVQNKYKNQIPIQVYTKKQFHHNLWHTNYLE